MKAAYQSSTNKTQKALGGSTLLALCISVFSISQLNSDFIGSLTEETAPAHHLTLWTKEQRSVLCIPRKDLHKDLLIREALQ